METTIRILLFKVAGKQKTKTDGSNSIFNVLEKRKTKTESRIPFSNDVGKRKTKLEVRIPFSYFAGKRLALRYTHCFHAANQYVFRRKNPFAFPPNDCALLRVYFLSR